MTEQPARAERDVPFRACCGKLRWALLDTVQSLPAGVHVGALRWGPAEIPVDVDIGAVSPERAVDAILDAAQARLGPSASCYAGLGTLVINGASR
jgi:hypothetical protein